MVVLWSQHLQRMASQCKVQITNRIMVPLWSFGQYRLFRVFQIPTIRSSYLRDLTPRLQQSLFFGFHCVTLATMFVKKYILASYVGQCCLRTVSTYYEWYRRWRWGVRQEPVDRDLWTCKVCIEPPEYDGYQSEYKLTLKESYMHIPHELPSVGGLSAPNHVVVHTEYVEGSSFPVMSPPSPRYVVDSLVITKYRGKYQVSSQGPDPDNEYVRDQAAQLIPSDVRFLCIQYLHPQMKGSPIELTIPPGMMMVGNQLLTPAFVLRLLEHTVGTHYGFMFDLNYTLSIMDSQIRMFNLSSTEFVVLDETTYTIVSQSKPTVEPSMKDIEDESGESTGIFPRTIKDRPGLGPTVPDRSNAEEYESVVSIASEVSEIDTK